MDRVELPPGVSAEGGPDGGGAGEAIHYIKKRCEATGRIVILQKKLKIKLPEASEEEERMGREEEEERGGVCSCQE